MIQHAVLLLVGLACFCMIPSPVTRHLGEMCKSLYLQISQAATGRFQKVSEGCSNP